MTHSPRFAALDWLYVMWGVTAGMNAVDFRGVKVSHGVTLLLIGVLASRVLVLRRQLGLFNDPFFASSILILVGGTVATLVVGEGGPADAVTQLDVAPGNVTAGFTAVAGGMTAAVAIMVAGARVGVGVLSAAHGIVIAALANGVATTWSPETVDGQRTGLMDHPNHTGLVIALGLMLHFALRSRDEYLWRGRFLGWLADASVVFICVYGLLRIGSRSAAVTLAIGLLVILYRNAKNVQHLTVVVAPTLLLAAVLLPSALDGTVLGDRLAGGGSATASNEVRLARLSTAADVIFESPILGSGFRFVSFAHNVPLQLWQTAGLMGLLALAHIVVNLVAFMRRAVSATSSTASLCLLVMVLGNWAIQNTIFTQYVWITILAAIFIVRGFNGKAKYAGVDRRGTSWPGARRSKDIRRRAYHRAPAQQGR